MRLINIQTLEFEDFVRPPKYVILSHRWQGSEITYEEYSKQDSRSGPGFEKIRKFCEFLKDSRNYPHEHRAHQILGIETGYTLPAVQYAWVDTCCIDKRNSSELSEAINSMRDWYWNALFCVAYLADVPDSDDWKDDVIFFCNSEWHSIGSKLYTVELREVVCTASGVPVRYFDDRRAVFKASVAKRMSWASQRQTTRPEDTAYCLFGLFRVNLPLLYGEGDNAFIRLQEEIIQQTDDESILAWRGPPKTNMVWKPTKDGSILAHHPSNFSDSGEIYRIPLVQRQPYRITNKGLEITAALLQVQEDIFLLRLNCAAISGAPTVTELLSNFSSHNHTAGKVVRGCMIPLRRRSDGTFLRSHINVWMNSPVASYKSFTTKQITESTLFIRTTSRETTGQDLDEDPDFLGELLAITDSDCLWTRTFPGNWFDRFQQQEVAQGSHSL